MGEPPRPVAVALGSNLGDRQSHLAFAATELARFLADLIVSDPVETAPEGTSAPTDPPFLNAVVVGFAADAPGRLLTRLHDIEAVRGRTRTSPGAPRVLDLDLILVGELTLRTPGLTLPHPRFRTRRFVLGPLASIAPDLVDPVTGRSIRELLMMLDRAPTRTGYSDTLR